MVIEAGAANSPKTNQSRQKMPGRSLDESINLAQSLYVNDRKRQHTQQFKAKIETALNYQLPARQISQESEETAPNISSQTQDNFQTIFEQTNIGIAFIANSGEFLRVNSYFCSLLKYSAETMCSFTFQDLTHSEDLETVCQSIERVLSGSQSSKTLEQRYLRQDGHWQWVSITFSLVKNSQNIPLYLIATIQDIQLRKQAEAKLKTRVIIDTAIAQISRKLLGIQEVNYEEILGIIGRATECDRAYLTCFAREARNSCTYHWHKVPQVSQFPSRQILALNQLSWWQEKLSKDEDIIINDIEQLSGLTEPVKNILRSLNICSALVIPVFTYSGRVWGTLSLCNQAQNERNWSEEDAQQLRILGAIIQSNDRDRVDRTKLKASEILSTNFFDQTVEGIFFITQ